MGELTHSDQDDLLSAAVAAYLAQNGVREEAAPSLANSLLAALEIYNQDADLETCMRRLEIVSEKNLDDYLTIEELMRKEQMSKRSAQRWASKLESPKATTSETLLLIAKNRVKRGLPPKGILLFPKDKLGLLANVRKKVGNQPGSKREKRGKLVKQ